MKIPLTGWPYLDSDGKLNVVIREPGLQHGYEVLDVDQLLLGWLGRYDGLPKTVSPVSSWNDYLDTSSDPLLELLTYLYGRTGHIVRYINSNGETVYEFLDENGKVQRIIRDQLRTWLAYADQAGMEKVLPEVFGGSLPAGGGEDPRSWNNDHRSVPAAILRRLATLRRELEIKEQWLSLKKQYSEKIRQAPGREERRETDPQGARQQEGRVPSALVTEKVGAEKESQESGVKYVQEDSTQDTDKTAFQGRVEVAFEKEVIDNLKPFLRLILGYSSETHQVFFGCLGMSDHKNGESFEALWQEAQRRALLTVTRILKGLVLIGLDKEAENLLPSLDLEQDSRGQLQDWLSNPLDNPPPVHLISSWVSPVQLELSQTPPLSCSSAPVKCESGLAAIVPDHERARANSVYEALKEQGPEKAEQMFRYEVGSVDDGEQAPTRLQSP